ncbi:hypothetical protein [Oceanicoccus sagamiensis]|uniref:Outer membrane protein beta-barrel domain-containing protein n=1 Tax=Oceanicoccus sagamiensis TaxID=716816 RepID=A0A1X9N390_9GAMM|nr:hypothetical protein [Oceanicoccus sagamiensis]ARN72680.1 hypothetical protein BST96_00260 [Oceanicoccus sagamiensis]
MKYANVLWALACLAASSFALGETHNFIQLSYVEERPDAEDARPSGLGILARYDIGEHIFIRGEIEDLEDKGVDVSGHALALAYRLNPHDPIVIHAAAIVEHEDEEEDGNQDHSLAKGGEIGFHAELGQRFVFHGEASAVYEKGDETLGLALGMLFKLSEHLGANIELSRDNDRNEGMELGLRYSF